MADDVETSAVDAAGANGTPQDESRAPERKQAPIDPAVLEDWRFIWEGREKGLFRQYGGQHIAVHQGKVLGSGKDPLDLLHEVVTRYGLEPNRVVLSFMD
jgi:hypothetical protein